MSNQKSSIEVKKLFLIGNLSIFMIGLGFAVRANIALNLQKDIFDHINIANSAQLVGEALGATFIGFAFTLLFGSALVDLVGMKRLLILSAFGYVIGSALILLASFLPISPEIYWLVLAGLLLTGLGWGGVEAVTNPMVASIYPKDKVARLNILHAWWPAGIVVGGLLGMLINATGIPWEFNLLILVLPASLVLWLIRQQIFPQTERVKLGVSYKEMFAELLKQPLFILWFICMMLTAATELAPGSWVNIALSRIVGMQGILLLVYVSALMFVLRYYASSLIHGFNSLTVLWVGSLLAAIGLYCLSLSTSPVTALLSATIWGVGVCYMWPTMLASVSERFPRGGALFLGLMGFAGGLSIQFVLPILGSVFDNAKVEAAGGLEAFKTLESGELLDAILVTASVESFQTVVIIPLVLLPVLVAIWFFEKKSKVLINKPTTIED